MTMNGEMEEASSNSVDCEENKQLGLESSKYQNVPSEQVPLYTKVD